MAPTWLLRGSLSDANRADAAYDAAVVRTVSAARLVLATLGLVAFALDPPESPLPVEAVLLPILVAFLAYSIALMVAAAVRPALSMRLGVAMHVLDVAWIVTLVAVSGGGDSPFTAFFVYAMLAASYRWGLRATLVTGAFAIIAVTLEALFGRAGLLDRGDHLNAVLIRLSYFAVASVLIGLLAEEERRQRLRSQSVARIMSRVRAESGMVASVRAVFEDVLSRLEASRGLLILYEDGGDVASLWHARRPSPGSALLVRLKQETPETCPTFMFPLPASIHAARIRARGGGRLTVEALNRDGVRCPEGGASAQPLLTASFDWDTALCVSQLSGEGWKGRLFVFDPRARDDHALRFLQAVVREVAPALFNLYLQRRLQSRTGSPDRLRVSQLLHDGVIQSLIGLEMELDVLLREAPPSTLDGTRERLARIQRALGQDILAVRDLMQSLKPVEVDPRRLPEHLAAMVREFHDKTGVNARLSSSLDEVDLPRRVCGEIVRAVQEALANVRKHSGAENVLVQLAAENAHLELVIEDDGKGFDFEGRLTGDQLDARHRSPVALRERVRAIRGQLAIDSRPGRGARVEITIPR